MKSYSQVMEMALRTACPFCNSLPRARPDTQTEQLNCKDRSCGIFEVSMPPRMWLRRARSGADWWRRFTRGFGQILKRAIEAT